MKCKNTYQWACALLLLFLFLITGYARADSWVPVQAVTEVSEDGNTLVRVEPGESWGDLFGFQGATVGRYARATYYRRDLSSNIYQPYLEIDMPNPVAPVDLMVNNQGVVVTLDNWHNAGYGKVVVIYSREGKIISAYELNDLYAQEEIQKIPRSVSSRWWRCSSSDAYMVGESAWVFDALGGVFEFKLKDGSFKYGQASQKCLSE